MPKTRSETKDFANAAYDSSVRWRKVLRQRKPRKVDGFETFEAAEGLYQLREGFVIHWFRSSEKVKRDAATREDKIASATEKLQGLCEEKKRGAKTVKALERQVEKILAHYGAHEWIVTKIDVEQQDDFRKTSPGKPGKESVYKRIVRSTPKLSMRYNTSGLPWFS